MHTTHFAGSAFPVPPEGHRSTHLAASRVRGTLPNFAKLTGRACPLISISVSASASWPRRSSPMLMRIQIALFAALAAAPMVVAQNTPPDCAVGQNASTPGFQCAMNGIVVSDFVVSRSGPWLISAVSVAGGQGEDIAHGACERSVGSVWIWHLCHDVQNKGSTASGHIDWRRW